MKINEVYPTVSGRKVRIVGDSGFGTFRGEFIDPEDGLEGWWYSSDGEVDGFHAHKDRLILPPTTAESLLAEVQDILRERGKHYGDGVAVERNMAKCVKLFNALTGTELTEEDGWIFMMLLKLSRIKSGQFRDDTYKDLIGYAVLTAETALNGEKG